MHVTTVIFNLQRDWNLAMSNTSSRTATTTATASLWASAFVLCAFILTQAGQLTGNTARAEMAVDGGEYALVTTKGGNDELLYVLEKRTGRVFVYEGGRMDLLDFQDVGEWVTRMTAKGDGK